MPFSGYRDIIQRRDRRLDTRQERRRQWRAVIVDSQGNQSGNGDIWADENARRLWVMPVGGGQPYQVLCVRIGRPVIGLGVIVGYAEGSNTQEVLRDDYEFLGPSNVGISWMSPSDTDFQPGGRMQLWIQSKMIQPLATYPVSGLIVGVVGGDYPYGGTRKTYAGTTSQDLTASQPAGGQHLLVGLYLDGNNTLQTIDGTAVAVASTPPEPSWPDGAFRLSVVRIANPQTSIAFLSETNPLNDIFDRRMTWSDENSGLSGLVWLIHDQVITIYTTITAAVTASVSGDTIVIPGGTFTETITINKSIALVGFEPTNTIITSSTNDTTTVTISAANVVLRYLKITNTGAGTAATAVGIVSGASNVLLDDCTIEKTSGAATTSNGVKVEAGSTHQFKDCRITAAVGATGYAIHCDTAASTVNVLDGRINGTLADIRTNHASAEIVLFDPILVNNIVTVTAGLVRGWFFNTIGMHRVRATSGMDGEVWRFNDNGLRVKETNLSTAVANAGTGDIIHLYPGQYSLTGGSLDVNIALTIVGEDPLTTIIQTSTNSVTAVTLSTAGASLRNLTIENTGAGSGGAGVFWTASSCVLDNCIVTVSGAGTTNYGIGPSGAVTGTVKNCQVTVSGATNNYGFAAVVGNSTTSIYNSRFSATQFDFYGTISGATATLNNSVLVNGSASFAGTFNWMPEAKIAKNLLYHSLTHNLWQEGATFNDIADDTYVADVWNVLHNGQPPDVSRQAGSGDPFNNYFRCTFDSASSQCGIVQFLENEDTIPLRGQTVSLSFDAWGTSVVELRAAVVYWTSTADSITSDVVGTWSTNNPTLAANWAYANTPGADITITSTRTRYAVNNITIPTTANNTGVFIWTSAEEASTDLFNIARVQLERGPVATEFVVRSFEEELSAVQRYLESPIPLASAIPTTTIHVSMSVWSNTIGAGTQYGQQFFKTVKRVTPTVTVYPYTTVTNTGRISNNAGTDQAASSGEAVSITSKQFGIQNNTAGNITTGANLILFSWKADARL